MTPALDSFVTWAQDHGVVLDGIKPKTIPGRGTGVIATRDIKENETILSVPRHLLRTLETIPQSTLNKLPQFADMSLHSLLAADLCINHTYPGLALWMAVLPTLEDFDSTPLRWPEELQALLPSAARKILIKQLDYLKRDWELVLPAFEAIIAKKPWVVHLTYDHYIHAWLLINSRTFYYYTPAMEKFDPKDRLALQPVADLFNHADEGCKVEFTTRPVLPRPPPSGKQPARKKQKIQTKNSTTTQRETSGRAALTITPSDDPAENGGYRFITRRPYREGEEVFISYGSHPNDLLLAEYGFIITSPPSTTATNTTTNTGGNPNKWDEVCLDELLKPRFTQYQREILEDRNYWGNYVIDGTTERPGCCWRTQVALRLLVLLRPSSSSSSSSGGGKEEDGEEEEEEEEKAKKLERWEKFMMNGGDDEEGEEDGEEESSPSAEKLEKEVEEILKSVLEDMISLAKRRIGQVKALGGGDGGGKEEEKKEKKGEAVGKKVQRDILTARWGQIEEMCRVVLGKLRD